MKNVKKDRCQCPQSGKPHFYFLGLSTNSNKSEVCQCPQSGNPHFYVMTWDELKKKYGMCQCPQSGNPHFYVIGAVAAAVFNMVSMPSVGQSSFLQQEVRYAGNHFFCVNALSRAILISTKKDVELKNLSFGVSMPSVGQSSFLLFK